MLRPVRLASSKPAQKAYLTTALFTATAGVLLGLASTTYLLFYWNFIPDIGVEKVVYLQYGLVQINACCAACSIKALLLTFARSHGCSPYAVIDLGQSIIPQQAYDISVVIDLPRSPPNLQMGNFMVDLVLLSPAYNAVRRAFPADSFDTRSGIPTDTILYSSRRPTILTYTPEFVTLGKQLAALPSYLLGWRKAEERLDIPMAEGVVFEKGTNNLPSKVYLDLQSKGEDVQVYNLRLLLRARLSGMRWLMYNHRIVSFLIGTGTFWAAELICAFLALLVVKSIMSAEPDEHLNAAVKNEEFVEDSKKIKAEEGEDSLDIDDLDLSDTPRSFPTYGRQAPLKYIPKIKREFDSEEMVSDELPTHPRVAEADDESEERLDIASSVAGGRSDSGLGTSYSEGGASLQRRRSNKSSNRSSGI